MLHVLQKLLEQQQQFMSGLQLDDDAARFLSVKTIQLNHIKRVRELSFFLSFAEFDSISDCLMMFHSEFSNFIKEQEFG